MCSSNSFCHKVLESVGIGKKKEPMVERVVITNSPDDCVPNYVSNAVSTRKYNWWSFLPLSLLYQFRMASNCYFLMLVVLVLIPDLAPVSAFSTIFPLVLILTVSEIREFIEEYQASLRDKRTNGALVNLLVGKRVESEALRPGDIVLLKRDERVPADIAVLQTANSDGSVYVETASLDGETNLKVRKCPSLISGIALGGLTSEQFRLTCESPHVDMYSFLGHFHDPRTNVSQSLTLDNVIWRGCTVRNTEWMAAVVVYAGQECKVMLNARSGIKPSKVTGIDKQMNRNVLVIFLLQVIICAVFASVGSSNFSDLIGAVSNPWYTAGHADQGWFSLFFAFFVLLSFFIPVSLWVCLELLKLLQAMMIEADPIGNIKCNAKNIHEELGQITHVFTDKTGTLTINRMKFVGIAVPGKVYLLPDEDDEVNLNKVSPESQQSRECILPFPGVTAPNIDLVRSISSCISEGNEGEIEIFQALSLCHSCERVVEPITGRLTNQSSTPDEAALVSAAAEVGFMFTGRPRPDMVTVRVGSIEKRFKLLHTIPFTNERRMMSVIVQEELYGPQSDNPILILSKGADSSIIPRCSTGPIEDMKISVGNFAYHGFRTLCVAKRVLEKTEWDTMATELANGASTLSVDVEAGGFEILGATALEDRLQDGVPETLRALKNGGIKVCMITGDKRETAINIAKACGLISSRKNVYVMLTGGVVGSNNDGQRAQPEREQTAQSSNPSTSRSTLVGGGSFVPLNFLNDVAKSSWPTDYWLNEVGNIGGQLKLSRNISRESTVNIDDRSKFSLVIDGKGLESIFSNSKSTQQLVEVLTFEQCEAVVFCRVSPKQKGEIVKVVQDHLTKTNGKTKRWSTLAIGDGANDVNMINIANVGVGIAGNEGAQAANSADYAISQFKDLYRLLFVHGRWNYRRTKHFIMVFIYKNFACAMCLFWFATVSSFSASTLFESTYLLLYNSVFGIVPLFIFGAIDKDVDPDADAPPKDWQPFSVTKQYWHEIVVPKLYKTAERFNTKTFMKWCLLGIIHSVVPFYFTWGAWGYGEGAIEKSGDIPSLWMSSIVVYTVEILLVSIVTMYVSASWTQLLVWSTLLLNIVAYFLFVFVYDYVKIPGTGVYPVYKIAVSTMGNFQFWVIIAITLLVSLAPIYWYKQLSKFRKSHIPSFVEAVMETKNRSRPVSQTQPTV